MRKVRFKTEMAIAEMINTAIPMGLLTKKQVTPVKRAAAAISLKVVRAIDLITLIRRSLSAFFAIGGSVYAVVFGDWMQGFIEVMKTLPKY